MNGTVYILMLDKPLGNGRHAAQFYIGFTTNLTGRLWHHRNGSGAAFTRAAVERGISIQLVYATSGTKADERRLKRQKNTRRWLRRKGISV